jgi:DNA repair protein RadC
MEAESDRISAATGGPPAQEAAMIVATARQAVALLKDRFEGLGAERLVVLHLDAGRHLIALDEGLGAGGNDSIALPVRTIIAAALRRDTSGLILAHNHPSGDPSPSVADVAATRRLAETAANVGIRLHDHLIFAADDCRSFRALGLL